MKKLLQKPVILGLSGTLFVKVFWLTELVVDCLGGSEAAILRLITGLLLHLLDINNFLSILPKNLIKVILLLLKTVFDFGVKLQK